MIKNLQILHWFITDKQWRMQFKEKLRRRREYLRGQQHATEVILRQTNNIPVITNGPFEGMLFSPALDRRSCSAQILLGTYEKEISEWIDELCERQYELIFDIGADVGWFAAGMAIRNPAAKVIAFEAESSKHKTIQKLLDDNNVTNVEVHGYCDADTFGRFYKNETKALAIIDIEGGEAELLNAHNAPNLQKLDILVETHDFVVEAITETLLKRFEVSHSINVVCASPRTLEDFPENVSMSESLREVAMDEFRHPNQKWILMKARGN